MLKFENNLGGLGKGCRIGPPELGRYDNPIPTWFLAPIDCLKSPWRHRLAESIPGLLSKSLKIPSQKESTVLPIFTTFLRIIPADYAIHKE